MVCLHKNVVYRTRAMVSRGIDSSCGCSAKGTTNAKIPLAFPLPAPHNRSIRRPRRACSETCVAFIPSPLPPLPPTESHPYVYTYVHIGLYARVAWTNHMLFSDNFACTTIFFFFGQSMSTIFFDNGVRIKVPTNDKYCVLSKF